jgi:hypothetical protein
MNPVRIADATAETLGEEAAEQEQAPVARLGMSTPSGPTVMSRIPAIVATRWLNGPQSTGAIVRTLAVW